ncbi:MAG: hypothetical protein Q7J07_07015 [Pelolinea sp.]|nr:hypothetical protein [Pelolinea sp.]
MDKKDRGKLVRRIYSDRYVLITLVSFAISISAIRIFLEINGYPQLGGENLHIAHVLWGGLFLFTSSLLPLIFVNKRILDLSAFLSGAGIGLFIDEVGKFITQTNDYFYPAAAPIIYVFFLLTIQIYRMIRKPIKNDLRTNLFHTLEEFEEVLEGDLSDIEKEKIINRMEKTEYAAEGKGLNVLKELLVLFLKDPALPFVEHKPDLFERITNWFSRMQEKIFTQKNFHVKLRLLWVFLGLVLIAQPLFILSGIDEPIDMTGLLRKILDSSLLLSENITIFGLLRIVLQMISGLLLWVCAYFYKNEGSMKWVSFAQLILLIVLSAINSLVFLYDQFSTIIFVIIEFIVFFLTASFLNWRTDTYL